MRAFFSGLLAVFGGLLTFYVMVILITRVSFLSEMNRSGFHSRSLNSAGDIVALLILVVVTYRIYQFIYHYRRK